MRIVEGAHNAAATESAELPPAHASRRSANTFPHSNTQSSLEAGYALLIPTPHRTSRCSANEAKRFEGTANRAAAAAAAAEEVTLTTTTATISSLHRASREERRSLQLGSFRFNPALDSVQLCSVQLAHFGCQLVRRILRQPS